MPKSKGKAKTKDPKESKAQAKAPKTDEAKAKAPEETKPAEEPKGDKDNKAPEGAKPPEEPKGDEAKAKAPEEAKQPEEPKEEPKPKSVEVTRRPGRIYIGPRIMVDGYPLLTNTHYTERAIPAKIRAAMRTDPNLATLFVQVIDLGRVKARLRRKDKTLGMALKAVSEQYTAAPKAKKE